MATHPDVSHPQKRHYDCSFVPPSLRRSQTDAPTFDQSPLLLDLEEGGEIVAGNFVASLA
jgi:hypothetical protein